MAEEKPNFDFSAEAAAARHVADQERAQQVYERTRVEMLNALWRALGQHNGKARDVVNALDNMLTARFELERQRQRG